MAGEGRNGEPRVRDLALEILQGGGIVQHRQMRMGIAGIAAGAEFHHFDAHALKLLEHLVQRQGGQQRREYTYFHGNSSRKLPLR